MVTFGTPTFKERLAEPTTAFTKLASVFFDVEVEEVIPAVMQIDLDMDPEWVSLVMKDQCCLRLVQAMARQGEDDLTWKVVRRGRIANKNTQFKQEEDGRQVVKIRMLTEAIRDALDETGPVRLKTENSK